MKTRMQSLSFLAILAIAFGMICLDSVLQAQNTPSTPPDRQAQQPSSPPDTTPPQSTAKTSPSPSPSMPDAQSPSNPPNQSPPQQTPADTTQSPDSTPSGRTPESGKQKPSSGSAADSGAAAGMQTFSGMVVKEGDKYVLKDDSGHTYDIDHQDDVKKFEGKGVRVQGTLDANSNKIMVK